MSDPVDFIVQMGFSKNRAERALANTGNHGVEAAMEWLIAHENDPGIDEPMTPVAASGRVLMEAKVEPQESDEDSSSTTNPEQALSLKCDECGKQLKSETDAQVHAAKTGHQKFSESTEAVKPLTEEEKAAQLKRVEEKLKLKRIEREQKEKEEAVQREKMRRKTGKEISEIRHRMELDEAKKLANEKKREKMEEKQAREKVKDQIAHDKAAKLAKDKAEAESAQAKAAEAAASRPVSKEYTTSKLQFRLFDGKTLTHTFEALNTLEDVKSYIATNRTDSGAPYSLMTNFPKKVFTATDSRRTLKDLGLVPSAVLILVASTAP
eukprot:Em0019g284a